VPDRSPAGASALDRAFASVRSKLTGTADQIFRDIGYWCRCKPAVVLALQRQPRWKTRPHGTKVGDAVMANIWRRNPSVTKLTDVESRKLLEQITAMAVELVAVDAVKRNPRNAKQHPVQQKLLIAENIRKFGVNHPLLVDENNVLIGGHARLAAAEL